MTDEVGLIILESQPFHNGHVKIISEALMRCSKIILVFTNYENNFFDYNINQQCGRNIFGNKNIYYQGINKLSNNRLQTILEYVKDSNIPIPTLLLSGYDSDIEEAKTIGLKSVRIGFDPKYKSDLIFKQIQDINNDEWKKVIPPLNHDLIETYIKTKLRNN